MAKARRSSGRSGKKKSRGILWLIVGLTLGAGLMYAAQLYMYKDRKPFTGLANLFRSAKPVEKPPVSAAASDSTEQTPKPKFDFYTILPGETVLPEPRRDGGRKSAKAEPPEKGVSYILQAAAYATLEDADRLKAKLTLNGLDAHIEKTSTGDKGTVYRVRLGPYSNIETLDATNAKLGKLGIKAIRIKAKKSAG